MVVTNILRRVLLSYIGAFLISVVLLPVMAWTMGVHSRIYLIVLGMPPVGITSDLCYYLTVLGIPIGITAGLCYADFRQRYLPTATLV